MQTLQAAYILHTRRYRDSSLLVDLLTREHGRLACIARGALRARRREASIQSFQPLLTKLRGRGEVLTLAHCESAGRPHQLAGRNLYCGLYLNELLLKLTPREDPCAALFDDYAAAVSELVGSAPAEPVLRRFEVRLLRHLGLGLSLEQDNLGQPIVASRSYTYDVHSGATPDPGGPASVSGRTLLALNNGEFGDAECLAEARALMRRILNQHLDGRPLHSRDLFR